METIIHLKKRENPFVMVDKNLVDDSSLSFKARGILVYLLSKPAKWTIRLKDICNHSTDGLESIQTGLQELRAAGYAAYKAGGPDGGSYWTVSEVPDLESGKAVSPLPVKPAAGKTRSGEIGTHTNTYTGNENESVSERQKQKSWPSLEEVKIQAMKIGLSPERAVEFYDFYESQNWTLSNGQPVHNFVNRLAIWKAKGVEPLAGKRSLSIADKRTIREAKEKAANELKRKHASETATGLIWNDPAKQIEYRKIKAEIKAIDIEIANTKI